MNSDEEETIAGIKQSLEAKPVVTTTIDQAVELRDKLRLASEELKAVKVQLDDLSVQVDELLLKPLREITAAKTLLYRKLNAALDQLKEETK